MHAFATIALLLAAVPCWASAGLLRAQAEAFAGQAIMMDPRLAVPGCPDGLDFAWRSETRSSVVARCTATGWAMILPVASAQSGSQRAGLPVVRRGQPVQIVAAGHGFRVLVDGVAERDGRAGERIVVRNVRSGRRMSVDIAQDGRMLLAGSAGPDKDLP